MTSGSTAWPRRPRVLPARAFSSRLGFLEEHLGVARPDREPRRGGSSRAASASSQRVERAQRVDADQIGLGLGDAPLGHLAGPLERAGVVAAPQPAAGGVVGVVGGELRVAVVELLEQLPGVGPVRLVGARQRQHVGRRQPLVAAARERLQRPREPRLGAAPSRRCGSSRRPALAAPCLKNGSSQSRSNGTGLPGVRGGRRRRKRRLRPRRRPAARTTVARTRTMRTSESVAAIGERRAMGTPTDYEPPAPPAKKKVRFLAPRAPFGACAAPRWRSARGRRTS